MKSCALTEPRQIGDVVDWVGHSYVIVKEISREEFWLDVLKRRRQDRERGRPRARVGNYDPETREFRPRNDDPPGDEFKYFYYVDEVRR